MNQKLLQDIFSKIEEQVNLSANLKILDNYKIEAYTDGETVYISTGLIKMLDADEVASILSHELAHIQKRHIIQEKKQLDKLLNKIKYDKIDGTIIETFFAKFVIHFFIFLFKLKRSRVNEYDADSTGRKILIAAGFDRNSMSKAFSKINKMASYNETPEILSTHPPMEKRIKNIQNKKIKIKIIRRRE